MSKLFIIVPFRDRESHLKEFIPSVSETLQKQNIDFNVVIVEQTSNKLFNRGKLLNIGFDVCKNICDYVCFHDVDMIPVDSDYSYCENPTHLAGRAQQFGWELPYPDYFGGVVLFDKKSFIEINGYANEYWGWGAEDDDVFRRCVFKNIKTSRKMCSFISLQHERIIDQTSYKKNCEKLFSPDFILDFSKDGLSSLSYKILETTVIQDNVTKILVEI